MNKRESCEEHCQHGNAVCGCRQNQICENDNKNQLSVNEIKSKSEVNALERRMNKGEGGFRYGRESETVAAEQPGEKQMMQKVKKMQERGMGSERTLCSSFIETKGEEKKEIDEEQTRRTGRICNNKERVSKRDGFENDIFF